MSVVAWGRRAGSCFLGLAPQLRRFFTSCLASCLVGIPNWRRLARFAGGECGGPAWLGSAKSPATLDDIYEAVRHGQEAPVMTPWVLRRVVFEPALRRYSRAVVGAYVGGALIGGGAPLLGGLPCANGR